MTKSCRVRQMVARLTAILLVGALASLLGTHPAHATTSTLAITATVNNLGVIDITVPDANGNPVHYPQAYAGSIVPSFLDGTALPFLYCVDVLNDIYIPTPNSHSTATGYSTNVTFDGKVHGNYVNHATQVAWLLDRYASEVLNDKTKSAALQAAIWEVIYGGQFTLNNAQNSTVYTLYNGYFSSAAGQSTSIENYAWLSPIDNSNGHRMQGLVTRVPEPGSTLLLALALSGLCGFGWWRRMR